jgi:hypothetical protein
MAGIRAYWNQYIKGADSTTEMPAAVGVTGDAAHVIMTDSSGTALGTAAAGLPVVDANLVPVAVKQTTSLSYTVAANLPDVTNQVAAGATVAVIQALEYPLRWSDDGVNPTVTFGMQLAAGDQFWYTGDLADFKMISQATGELAEVNVAYYKQA